MKLLRIAFYTTLLVAASTSIAQTKRGDVVADIPFAFMVAGHAMPAGHYIVSPVNEFSLGIRDRKNQGAFVPTHSVQRPAHDNTCKIVFHRYGDAYFLSEVWVTGNTTGRELPASRAERELAARGIEKGVTIVAAAR